MKNLPVHNSNAWDHQLQLLGRSKNKYQITSQYRIIQNKENSIYIVHNSEGQFFQKKVILIFKAIGELQK